MIFATDLPSSIVTRMFELQIAVDDRLPVCVLHGIEHVQEQSQSLLRGQAGTYRNARR